MYLRYVGETSPKQRLLHHSKSYTRLRALVQSLHINGVIPVTVHRIEAYEAGESIELVRVGRYAFRLLLRDPERSMQYVCTLHSNDKNWSSERFAYKLQALIRPAAATTQVLQPTLPTPVTHSKRRNPPPVTALEVARGFEVDRRLRALLRRP